MRAWLGGALVFLGLVGPSSALAHRKRTDPCGCHHQYGLRHCHPKLKTDHCEAPAKGTEQPKKKKAKAPAPEKL